MTNIKTVEEWKEKVRDWWYATQDDCSGMMHTLEEKRRVEIEHIIKDALTTDRATILTALCERIDMIKPDGKLMSSNPAENDVFISKKQVLRVVRTTLSGDANTN